MRLLRADDVVEGLAHYMQIYTQGLSNPNSTLSVSKGSTSILIDADRLGSELLPYHISLLTKMRHRTRMRQRFDRFRAKVFYHSPLGQCMYK